jgi:type IV secretion system protein VirB6
VIFIAYEIIYSQRDVIMSEVTKTIMAFTAVGAFTYSAPYYAQYVIPFVMHAGQDLSSAVTGNLMWQPVLITYGLPYHQQ